MTLTGDNEVKGEGALPSPDIREQFPMRCNVEDATLYDNVRRAVESGLPVIAPAEPHGVPAILVGGGPSLAETFGDILVRYRAGYHVYAFNGAAKWLVERGVIPYGVVMLDARPFNRQFVEGLPPGVKYLIASQCDAGVFEALAGQEVTVWHPDFQGKSGVTEPRATVCIAGGTVVGTLALRLLSVLGYREFHLFGYDSSYRAEAGHAYAQPQNAGETLVAIAVNGVEYLAAPWMIRQADDFQILAGLLANEGHEFHVYGNGLLPAVAQEVVRRRTPVNGGVLSINYDLSTHPASFDFVLWLMTAETYRRARGFDALDVHFKNGPNEGFRNDELPVDTEFKRALLENVMKPAARMIGATISDEPGEDINLSYTGLDIVTAARQGAMVPFFSASWESRAAVKARYRAPYVTVTLREASYWPTRNSNIQAWQDFALWCDLPVVFVRDTEKADEPMSGFLTDPKAAKDLDYRLALYEGAKVNLFVSNGPHAIALFSSCNWIQFKQFAPGHKPSTPEWFANVIGVPEGTQYPWSHGFQKLAWCDDTLGNIQAAYSVMAAEIDSQKISAA